jgi:cell cycle checkpoint protein
MMVKVLNKIASQEASQGHFAVPSARVVESIAMSSAGDVRSAINALQFACRQGMLITSSSSSSFFLDLPLSA